MFEELDFDTLVDRMLSNVSDDFDKREGSIIYDAVAPAALELANAYIALDMILNEVFADTASYYYLIKRAAEKGIYPNEETYAVAKMVVTPADTPISINDRFNLGDLNYTVTSIIDTTQGTYKLTCETAGIIGNQQLGELLPIETENELNDMESATITEILIPGEDEEDVEVFRERYFASFNQTAFGGNKADYMEKVNDIAGVGACKVIRAWNDGYKPSDMIPTDTVATWYESQSADTVGEEVYSWLSTIYNTSIKKLLTVGGTVKIPIISSEFKAPSSVLVDTVQTAIDPTQNAGEGEGIAPIGHVVNVEGVENSSIDIEVDLLYKEGYSFVTLEDTIKESIDTYFTELAEVWANSDNLIVRISQIEARMLLLDGVLDVVSVKLNGVSNNIILEYNQIPVRGDLVG